MRNKLLLPLILTILLTSCSQSTKVIESKFFCFDTYVEVDLYGGSKKDAKNIEGILVKYDKLTDNYRARDVNNVYTLNHTNDEIEIDTGLFWVLNYALGVKGSNGAQYFDPLCGSLAKLWKEAISKNQVLDQATIDAELVKKSATTLTIKDLEYAQRIGDAEIDLGGIAKGYTLDVIKSYLKEKKVSKYIINAGSSSILLGEKTTKDGLFNIGLKDIKGAYIKAKNCFVSTSGISEQFTEIDGVKYSHIVNPITGSTVCKHDAVIVISDQGYVGDALSTSMMMNTVNEIKQIETEQGVKTIVIDNNQITYKHNEIEVYNH